MSTEPIDCSNGGVPLRVLVCGGSGFIGSHLCRRLRKSGHYVIAADWKLNSYTLHKPHQDYEADKEKERTTTGAGEEAGVEESESESESDKESVYSFCDEFHHVDLRVAANCDQLLRDSQPVWVFNLAADMGGMGFIQSNHSVILYNNLMISLNLLEAARKHQDRLYCEQQLKNKTTNATATATATAVQTQTPPASDDISTLSSTQLASPTSSPSSSASMTPTSSGASSSSSSSSSSLASTPRVNGTVQRFFYASSACVYPERLQLDEQSAATGLVESSAWPAQPQDAYGLEKLVTEEMCLHYARDFGLVTRVARFHNIYGPMGTWKGGREKAPAAFCRKVLTAIMTHQDSIEVWGNGEQTRSFCYIDDCIEGILRLTLSHYDKPINIGSDEMVTVNQMIKYISDIEGVPLKLVHLSGPEGVRGRNSNNALIESELHWAPRTSLRVGLQHTYAWIKQQMLLELKKGNDISTLAHSHVVKQTTNSLDTLGQVYHE